MAEPVPPGPVDSGKQDKMAMQPSCGELRGIKKEHRYVRATAATKSAPGASKPIHGTTRAGFTTC